MLSKMFYEGADYDEVLKEAQANGYAERNPEADVEGYDTDFFFWNEIKMVPADVCGC